MSDLLIPFGIHRETNGIVEPEDAERGRAANCLCPGCKAPLLSRHPKANRIHFAHDSKHEDATPEEECPFNAPVAVAMMIRELAGCFANLPFKTPLCHANLSFDCCSKPDCKELVSLSSEITIDSVTSNYKHNGQAYDVALHINDHLILVDLFYTGKPAIGIDQDKVSGCKAGILEINCDLFLASSLLNDRKKRFSDAVKEFFQDSFAKEWKYHPREEAVIAKAKQKHTCPAGYDPVSWAIRKPERITPETGEPRMVACQMCKATMTTNLVKRPAMGFRCNDCKPVRKVGPPAG